METKQEFKEIQSIVSLQSHENITLIVFENYENDLMTLEIPTSQIFEWFDKEQMKHIYKTYTNYLISKL